MDKVHHIEFTTDGDINELNKKITDCVKKAYEIDKKEIKECDEFIKTLVKLTKLTYRLPEDLLKGLDGWLANMLSKPAREKRSFVYCYRKHFSDIGEDVIGLAREFSALSNKSE